MRWMSVRSLVVLAMAAFALVALSTTGTGCGSANRPAPAIATAVATPTPAPTPQPTSTAMPEPTPTATPEPTPTAMPEPTPTATPEPTPTATPEPTPTATPEPTPTATPEPTPTATPEPTPTATPEPTPTATPEPHEVTFPGGLHDQLGSGFLEQVRRDVRWVVALMARRFAVKIDPDRLEIRIPTTPDALRQQHGLVGREPGRPLGSFARPATGGDTKHLILLPWTNWGGRDQYGDWITRDARPKLAHEYYHVMQFELSAGRWVEAPPWLVEGAATRLSFQLEGKPYKADEVQHLTTQLDLSNLSVPSYRVHSVGVAAASMLADLASLEALVEYWANLAPENGKAVHQSIVFEQTFGLSVEEFNQHFHDVRRPLFALVSGKVRASDGPVPPVWIWASPSRYIDTSGIEGNQWAAETQDDGSFSMTLPRYDSDRSTPLDWRFFLARRIASREDTRFFLSGCEAVVASDRSPQRTADSAPYILMSPDETVGDLDFHVSTNFCKYWVSARLTDASGEPLEIPSPNFCLSTDGPCMSLFGRKPGEDYSTEVSLADSYVLVSPGHCATRTSRGQVSYVADGYLTPNYEEAYRFAPSLEKRTISFRITQQPPCEAE